MQAAAASSSDPPPDETGALKAVDESPAAEEEEDKAAPNALLAAVPFGSMLLATPIGMYLDGRYKLGPSKSAHATILDTLAAADSTAALTWATLLGNLLAIGLPLIITRCSCHRSSSTIKRKPLTLSWLMSQWVEGIMEVSEAVIILLLAWALGAVVRELHAAQYLASALSSWLPSHLLPFVSMLLAMATSFGIGSAWGTMGVLVPLVAPLAWELSHHNVQVLTESLGAVLGGAVFGNVASPIADTSVLSSMVTRCPMLDHVASQATYVALTAVCGLALGALPVGLGAYPCGVGLLASVAVIVCVPLVVKRLSRRR